jgi:hypothetical protein
MIVYDIWLPREYGAREADKAAKEYDPRLGFGFNQDTHQWCIFFEQGTTEESREHKLPILGFNGIPHPDDVKKRLYESDSLRRGEEILAAINRDNEKVKQVFEAAASEGSEAAAEGFEYLMRQAGQAPYHKSFRKIVKE